MHFIIVHAEVSPNFRNHLTSTTIHLTENDVPRRPSHQRIRSHQVVVIINHIHHHASHCLPPCSIMSHHVTSCHIMSGQHDLDGSGDCGICISCVFKWTFSGSTSFTMAFLRTAPIEQPTTLSSTSPRLVQNCLALFSLKYVKIIFKDGFMTQNYEPPEWMVSCKNAL